LQVLGLTLDVLTGLASRSQPVDEEELQRAKMHLRGQHSIGAESTHTRMSRLATQELYFGRHISSQEVLEQIDAVDTEGLHRLTDEWLQNALGDVTIAVVGPEAPDDDCRSRIEQLLDDYVGDRSQSRRSIPTDSVRPHSERHPLVMG